MSDLPVRNPFSEPIELSPDRNPFRVYLARLAAGSRPTMAEALESVARIASGGRVEADRFPWHRLRYQHTQAVRAALVETVSGRTGKPLAPSTINKALSALRGVLREAWRLGLMSAEDLARATDLAPVRGSVPLRGRALEHWEVVALFRVCMEDPTPAGPRDAAILALGLGAGLRRAEVVALDLADVDLGREVVRVHGKGRKIREVPVKGGTLEAPMRGLVPLIRSGVD
jgi:site-specific recombinase XerC